LRENFLSQRILRIFPSLKMKDSRLDPQQKRILRIFPSLKMKDSRLDPQQKSGPTKVAHLTRIVIKTGMMKG